MKNLNITVYIEKCKINKQGLAPIYCKISLPNEKPIKFTLGESANYDRWITTNQFKDSRDYTEKKFRTKNVDETFEKLYAIEEEFKQEQKAYTAEMVKNRFLGKDIALESKTYNEAFIEFKRRFMISVKNGKLVEATFNKYNSMKNKFDKFLKTQKMNDIVLTNINSKFNKDFHLFIQDSSNSNNSDKKKTMSLNTSNKYLISFRHIISSAVEWEWIKTFPLPDYKFEWDSKDTISLTEEEIQLIVQEDCSSNERLNRVKYLYLFMCVTAFAYSDLKELRKSDIEIVDGEKVINKFRKKTKKYKARASVVLTEDALNIIDMYSDLMKDSEFLLPVPDNSDFNVRLKFLSDKTGIQKNLTCHVARHTAGVIAAMKGFTTREIAAMLGHKNERMSLHYSAIAKTKLSQSMKKFEGLISSRNHLKVAI